MVDKQLRLDFAQTALMSVDEIYDSATAEFLRGLPEDRRIERKPATVHAEHLGGVYYPMWANTPEGGLLVVGIEDDGTISGCHSLDQKKLNKLERAGHVYCPDARSISKRIPAIAPDGSDTFLLLFRIYYREDKLVRNQRGGAYARIGGSKRRLTHEEMRELEADKGQISLELEPCQAPYPDAFDRKSISDFVARTRMTEE